MQGVFNYPTVRVREVDVTLDEDLARHLGVQTREVNQYLKRTRIVRQPYDAFRITREEAQAIVHKEIGNRNPRRNHRYPYMVYSKRLALRIIWDLKRFSLV